MGLGSIESGWLIARAMRRKWNYDLPSSQQIANMSSELNSLKLASVWAGALENYPADGETRKALIKIVNATSSLQRIFSSTKPADERATRRFHAQRVVDSNGDDSPTWLWSDMSGLMAHAAKQALSNFESLISVPASADDGRNLKLPRASPGMSWNSELMGNYLLDIYESAYPQGKIGGRFGSESDLQGPQYYFISMCMRLLGRGDFSANAVKSAIALYKKTNK